ncbi:MAG: 30S ribosomal protein S17 [Anaerolineae bacterium]|nr:30S ribosomal protein S17 [Anaerolineae bacterium]
MANKRKRLVGRVVSDKMDKTVVVAIDINKQHRIYKKVVRTTKKIYAHDESNEIQVGSIVRLVESKPISKSKRWVVEAVIQDNSGRILEPIAGEVTLDETEEQES